MKRIIPSLFILTCLLASCNSTPQENFSQAVLNCNLLYGFAGNGMQRELSSPSEKLINENTGATAPMKRTEMLNDKLQAIEACFKKVKALSVNDDNKEMLNASVELYNYVLPVYKKEYMQLATLYDDGASKEKTEAAEKNITDRYETGFLDLYNKVQVAGKSYADRHGIVVRVVDPTPPTH